MYIIEEKELQTYNHYTTCTLAGLRPGDILPRPFKDISNGIGSPLGLLNHRRSEETSIKILKSSFEGRGHIRKMKPGQCFEIQALRVLVTLT